MTRRFIAFLALAAAFALGIALDRTAQMHDVRAASINPSQGYTIHVDAEKHFGDAHPGEVAHHWCKAVAGGMTECQIYESDTADAHLVAVETIVPTKTWQAMPASEKAYWHYHRTEIPRVNAKTPDMTPDEAKKLVEALNETYGKVYVLWDPMSTNDMPLGTPTVSVLKE